MDEESLRLRFAEFAGVERYRKFVKQVVWHARKHGRLRYWQAELWAEFVAENPQFAVAFAAVCEAFNLCWLHNLKLKERDVPVVDCCIDYAQDFVEDRAERFPHSAPPFVSTEGAPKKSDTATVQYCEECESVHRNSRWGTPIRGGARISEGRSRRGTDE